VEFHGDFRIGGPFGVIGGWNARLGWSTTNNDTRLSDIYALAPDLVKIGVGGATTAARCSPRRRPSSPSWTP
jgi:hypothetical protein